MKLSQVLEGAKKALSDRRAAREWVRSLMAKINPNDLSSAVQRNADLWMEVVSEFHLDDPAVLPLASAALKMQWKEVEQMADVPKIYQRLAKNKLNLPILEKPETKRWLNWNLERAYLSAYYYAFGVDAICHRCRTRFPVFPVEFVENEPLITSCPSCNAEVGIVLPKK